MLLFLFLFVTAMQIIYSINLTSKKNKNKMPIKIPNVEMCPDVSVNANK